jgi:3-hydroxyacyl-CoA dehydrogenase
MGHGIACVCATSGIDTVLYDVDLSAVDDGLKLIRQQLDKAVSQGELGEPEREAALGRIRRSSDLAFAVQGAELDVQLEAAKYLYEALESEAFRPPKLLEQMVVEGKLGQKSGEGFYRWNDDTWSAEEG